MRLLLLLQPFGPPLIPGPHANGFHRLSSKALYSLSAALPIPGPTCTKFRWSTVHALVKLPMLTVMVRCCSPRGPSKGLEKKKNGPFFQIPTPSFPRQIETHTQSKKQRKVHSHTLSRTQTPQTSDSSRSRSSSSSSFSFGFFRYLGFLFGTDGGLCVVSKQRKWRIDEGPSPRSTRLVAIELARAGIEAMEEQQGIGEARRISFRSDLRNGRFRIPEQRRRRRRRRGRGGGAASDPKADVRERSERGGVLVYAAGEEGDEPRCHARLGG